MEVTMAPHPPPSFFLKSFLILIIFLNFACLNQGIETTEMRDDQLIQLAFSGLQHYGYYKKGPNGEKNWVWHPVDQVCGTELVFRNTADRSVDPTTKEISEKPIFYYRILDQDPFTGATDPALYPQLWVWLGYDPQYREYRDAPNLNQLFKEHAQIVNESTGETLANDTVIIFNGQFAAASRAGNVDETGPGGSLIFRSTEELKNWIGTTPEPGNATIAGRRGHAVRIALFPSANSDACRARIQGYQIFQNLMEAETEAKKQLIQNIRP